MRHTTSSVVRFDVGHAAAHPAACARQHGHRVAITIGCTGSPGADRSSYVVDPDVLLGELSAIRRELENRDLTEMIAPSKPTAAGLAGWVWERLALRMGEALASVEVKLGDLSARIDA